MPSTTNNSQSTRENIIASMDLDPSTKQELLFNNALSIDSLMEIAGIEPEIEITQPQD